MLHVHQVDGPPKAVQYFTDDDLSQKLSDHDVEVIREIFNTPLTGSYNWDYETANSKIRRLYELGKRFNIRVTFVATGKDGGASRGKVLADSGVEPSRLSELPDHSNRPEIVQALDEGFGTATRFSDTLTTEMLYVASTMPSLAGTPDGVLRIAVPYSAVQQVLTDARNQLLAIVAAMAVCAAGLALFLIFLVFNALAALAATPLSAGLR